MKPEFLRGRKRSSEDSEPFRTAIREIRAATTKTENYFRDLNAEMRRTEPEVTVWENATKWSVRIDCLRMEV
jgi:DNA-directed RNA polymerase specialized sigma54-like protein